MLVTLSGFELEDALQMYLEKQFNRKVEVLVDEGDSVIASVELKEVILPIKAELEEENHNHSIQESEEVKPKRTRRKRVEVLDEEDNPVSETTVEEEVEKVKDEKTKYADLPRLNQEDQAKYTQILTLLNTNPRNKNRLQLEQLSINISEDLKTVLNASEHYQDWLKYCQEQDSEAAMNEILKQEEPEITDEENVIDTKPTELVEVEEVKEVQEESLEDRTLRLMKEVNEEENIKENEPVQEPEKSTKTLFGSPNPSVSKAGSIFPSQPSRRVF